MTKQRPFQVGDEVRWRWHEHDETGKWFKAKLTEQHPEDYPSGWAGRLTDRGTFYEGDESWDAPLDFVVYMDEPSMTLVTPVAADHELTPNQIEDTIARAVREHEFDVIPSLVRLLAVQSPDRAQKVLDALQGRYTVDLNSQAVDR